ncbi:UNVERIFIED_CONTAM: polyprotein [Sesamum radiatum]|uniref:Polyprotein n=1 Tax=Sesamum radiatum TaxID=300843 RepID=A0AAW2JLP0_SESRA
MLFYPWTKKDSCYSQDCFTGYTISGVRTCSNWHSSYHTQRWKYSGNVLSNFAVSLSDPHVASAFKVQVQITGANQVPASVMATLHHQLVFRLQNHSLDLPNQGSRDAPMVLANSGTEIPTIIQIPRQIQRKDLEKLVPTEWITNYESLQQQHETVKSTDFRFKSYQMEESKLSLRLNQMENLQTLSSS